MKKALIASLAAVTILGSTAVYAQHRFHHHHQARVSPQDRAAFIDARIAAVKAGLQLTPDQEKNWPPVETAVRDFAKMRIDRANARASEWEARRAARANTDAKGDKGDQPQDRAEQRTDTDPVARLRERADAMAATAAGLKRIADAADPLYKSLDDSQKRRLRVLTRMSWREHGFGDEPGRGFDRDSWRNRDGGRDRGRGDRPGTDRTERL